MSVIHFLSLNDLRDFMHPCSRFLSQDLDSLLIETCHEDRNIIAMRNLIYLHTCTFFSFNLRNFAVYIFYIFTSFSIPLEMSWDLFIFIFFICHAAHIDEGRGRSFNG